MINKNDNQIKISWLTLKKVRYSRTDPTGLDAKNQLRNIHCCQPPVVIGMGSYERGGGREVVWVVISKGHFSLFSLRICWRKGRE